MTLALQLSFGSNRETVRHKKLATLTRRMGGSWGIWRRGIFAGELQVPGAESIFTPFDSKKFVSFCKYFSHILLESFPSIFLIFFLVYFLVPQ